MKLQPTPDIQGEQELVTPAVSSFDLLCLVKCMLGCFDKKKKKSQQFDLETLLLLNMVAGLN